MTGWNLFALILIGAAILIANRSNAKDPKAAVWYMSGWFTTFILCLAFLMVILPLVITYAPQPTAGMWQPVVGRAEQDMAAVGSGVSAAVASIINVGGDNYGSSPLWEEPTPESTPPGEPVAAAPVVSGESVTTTEFVEHAVQAGEVLAEIAEWYGVNLADLVRVNELTDPNRLEVGQVLRVPVAVQATATPLPILGTAMPEVAAPLPTPTPTPLPDFSPQFAQIETYKRAGNRASALEVIAYIQGLDPGNAQAHAIKAEIEMAEALLNEWGSLGERRGDGTFVHGESDAVFVTTTLTGFRFVVAQAEKRNFVNKWKESVTVQCESAGWLYGESFVMARGHAAAFGADEVGEVFTVYAGGE